MSAARLRLVAADEFRLTLRRPMVLTLLAILVLLSWGIADGAVGIALGSGDASVGGKRAFVTSQFAVAQVLAIFVFSIYTFFVSPAAGLSVIRDDEARVLEVLLATPLRAREYAWGKFLGVAAAFATVLALHLAVLALFLHVIPNDDLLLVRGPFAASSYLVPGLVLGLPTILFMTGLAFGIGTGTRRAILAFAVPVALVMLGSFFFMSWSPTWLPLQWNRLLMVLDPSAVRWLSETYLKVDRGAEFYNTQPIGLDAMLVANRVLWLAVGGLTAAWGVRRFARSARASHAVPAAVVQAALVAPAPAAVAEAAGAPALSLAGLGMRPAPLGAWATVWGTLRAEARELAARAGLYLFVPLIVLQVVSNSLLLVGAFDTPLLRTPGQLAATQAELMAIYVVILLIFYGVESLERERATRLDAITDTLPVHVGAVLAGKVLALGVVWLVIALASIIASTVIVLVQGQVPFTPVPFLLLWGLLFLPTFLFFATFLMATWTTVRNRYTTYAVAFAALALTIWASYTDHVTWVTDWGLYRGIPWSDIAPLQLERGTMLLNRALWLAMAVACWAHAVEWYPRTATDLVGRATRRSWRGLRAHARRAVPYLAVPTLLAFVLWRQVEAGPAGSAQEQRDKDYWKRNLATWRDVPVPWLKAADLDITIEPAERRFRVRGSYVVFNHRDTTYRSIPLTIGRWTGTRFTADGDTVPVDTATALRVLRLARPLAPGDSVRVAFAYEGDVRAPRRQVGTAGEFITPSSVVMTAFSRDWFPLLGYVDRIGTDEDNTFEPRRYPDDWYTGPETPAGFGSQRPMTLRTRITVPRDFMANGVGELVADSVHGDTRTVIWVTDHPVTFFNVIAGRWAVKRGEGTALYYHPAHTYNIDEMSAAMEAARRWYGTWFGAYPWKLLKVSEFAGLATYAQGFPTNISFSEQIGFLAKSDPRTNVAFMVTAHEIAHQWWGNMLQPADGPGANLLSEGMSHFATMLLLEQVKGAAAARELRTRFETRWADGRRADAERRLYEIDGARPGDGVVTYEKAGWTFWMLADRMGRPDALRGMKDFIAKFDGTGDHASLQDLVAHLRGYARDTTAYDDFARQWFDTVSVLEYKVTGAAARRAADGTAWETEVTVRNVGTARMPVDVAVTRGERPAGDSARAPAEPWRQAVTTVTLAAGDSARVTVRSPFEPQKAVVDPDVRLLMLRRQLAERTVDRR